MSKIVRLYFFTKAYYDCLEAYFGSPLLTSGDHPLSRAFVRLRLVVEELLRDEEYHQFASHIHLNSSFFRRPIRIIQRQTGNWADNKKLSSS